MKCQICGVKTRINWGNSGYILCEEHSESLSEITNSDISPTFEKKYSNGGPFSAIFIGVFVTFNILIGIYILSVLGLLGMSKLIGMPNFF